MPSRHAPPAVDLESPVLFARYPLPPPPSHSHLSYLHAHPFSSHFSLYSDPVALTSPTALNAASRPVAVDSYDSLMSMRSLADDIETIHRESARRLDELVSPTRHTAADSVAYTPPPVPSSHQSDPPQSAHNPAPSGLSPSLLSLLSLHSHRLTSRGLGLLLSVDRQPSCAICLSGLVVGCVVSVLHCGHCLHTDCLLPWLEKSGACPLCRARVRVDREQSDKEEEVETVEDDDDVEALSLWYEDEQRRWRQRWAQNAASSIADGEGLRDWRYA